METGSVLTVRECLKAGTATEDGESTLSVVICLELVRYLTSVNILERAK